MKNKFLSSVGALLVCFVVFTSVPAASGDLDTSFEAFLTNKSYSLTANHIQADGKILVAGNFDTANNRVRPYVARFFPDGTLDTTFYSPLTLSVGNGDGNPIQIIKTQSNGKILIGGKFYLNNSTVRTFGLLRLNTDGSLDTTFNSAAAVNSLIQVFDFEVTSNNKIVVSGLGNSNSITETLSADGALEATQTGGGKIELLSDDKVIVASNQGTLRRLNQDLTVDGSFQGSSVTGITDLATLSDGRVVVIGFFGSIQGFAISRIARFNADGSLDTTFNAGNSIAPNNEIGKIVVGLGGKIYIGGAFTALGNTPANRVARINPNGSVDTSFTAPANLPGSPLVLDLDIQPDEKILVNSSSANFRLNTNGSLDTSYDSPQTTSGTPFAKKILVQPDNKILASYGFNTANEKTAIGLVRFNTDGTIDTGFNPVPDNATVPFGPALAIQSDGKILVPASLATNVVRLNIDGSRDGTVFANTAGASLIAALPGGKTYIAGFASQAYLRRYNSDGSVDTTFNSVLAGGYVDLVVQPDGKLLVANNNPQGRRIYRLNSDGSNDATFNPNGGANNSITKIELQPDGKILVGGSFTSFNQDTNRKYLVRLNSDGSIDTTFNPNYGALIYTLKLLNNGKILLVSDEADGSQVSAVLRIRKLESNGSPDAAFNPPVFVGGITSLDVQSGNRIIAGGTFRVVSGVPKIGIARLLGDSSSSRPMYDFDGDGKADVSVFRPSTGYWYTSQNPAANYGATLFGQSGDRLVPADYDGDGKTDVAVVRGGNWYIQRSALGFTSVAFGDSNDVLVPADYDGDGRADVAVFRPSNGTWYLLQSSAGFTSIAFGLGTDKPVPGDYNGDGKAEVAVFRPSNGYWYLSPNPATNYGGVLFGQSEDRPVPADYDGDGKTDVAVFRPSNGTWYLLQSTAGFAGIAFGLGTDAPVPADYDGDGRADVAVFRQGNWYLNRSTQGFTGIQFGTSTDSPIPNAFVR